MFLSLLTLSVCILICPVGNLIGDKYQEKVDDLKKESKKAMESFDRSLRLEIFKAIHGIGEHITSSLDLDMASIEFLVEWSSQMGFLRQELRVL